VIVVVGRPLVVKDDDGAVIAGGMAAAIAREAAVAGASVQLAGRLTEGPDEDAVLFDLTRSGVGHAAMLREAGTAPPGADGGPGGGLGAGDLDLALRYLTSFGVLVVADTLGPDAWSVVADAAAYTGAYLVAVLPPGTSTEPAIEFATMFEGPLDDPDGEFGALVGRYAAALDAGSDAGAAFRGALGGSGWEEAPADDDSPRGR
jgi:hypothetical protein